MIPEGHSAAPSPSSSPARSPSAKRSRDPEDDIYIDNLHSHKRYLSEIMASSLNGLTVGDTMSENLMDSPLRSDSLLYARDEISSQYSPMSEDSYDSRYYDNPTITCPSQPESIPTSPVSPYRCQKPPSTSQPRQRGTDAEGRFPSSPSDICHSADLRRAALLRSVQMRSSSQFELPGQESGNTNMESDERPCSYVKDPVVIVADERDNQIEECALLSVSECENVEKSCGTLERDGSADV